MTYSTKPSALELSRMGFRVFPLKQHGKEPATKHGFKDYIDDPEVVEDGWPDNDYYNIGVVTGEGLLTIDVDRDDDDGYDGHETVLAWEREHGELPETASFITGRGGYQLIYHVNREIRIDANEKLHVDVRCDGGYFMAPGSVHPNGNIVEWENHPEDVPIADADDNVYAFIDFITDGTKRKHKRFKMPKKIKAGGRNNTLTKYGCSLQGKGIDDDVIAASIIGANISRCEPPLDEDEVDGIIESVLNYHKGMSDEAKAAQRKVDTKSNVKYRKATKEGNHTGPIQHNLVARDLIDNHKACVVDGAPAIWNGERYASGWHEINRQIIRLIDDCKMADQREIRNYVNHMAPSVKAMKPWKIAFSNGVLDIDLGMSPFTDSMVVTNIIPHDYDESAYCKEVDEFLDNISCHDKVIRMNLEEVIGVCMYRSNDFGQCPVLIGVGSNGKSTYISALRNVLGNENVSSLDINIIGKPFQAGRLLGKLANLGDDISNERLNGDILAVFKKIVTGDWIYTDVKNSDGFEFKPYCTLVFSCNDFPRLSDSSEGMMRRLFPIPFDARFSRDDPDYNPRIGDKLTTEEAAQYLITLGVQGLRRVRENKGFTPSVKGDDIIAEVKSDNDSVTQWLEDKDGDRDYVYDRQTDDCYSEYTEWCKNSGLMPCSKRNFSIRLRRLFNVVSTPTTRGGKSMRVYR